MNPNTIHPTAVIDSTVSLGRDIRVGPNAVIVGRVEIGDRTYIGAGAVIGVLPEVRSVDHLQDAEERPEGRPAGSHVVIGSDVIIREGAQIHAGWRGLTRVGDRVMIMNQSYVAHDCEIEDDATLASSVLLAGHVTVGRGANLGLGAKVHQRVVIGPQAMIGMGSVVTRDVPPWALAYGVPARVRGANAVGLERAGLDADVRDSAAAALALGEVDEMLALPAMRGVSEWWRARVTA